MDAKRNNVVPLHRHGIPPEDADAIEMIMLVHCGEEVAISDMEITDEPFDSICRRMNAESGAVFSDSKAWCFPVATWKYQEIGGRQLVLTVIDQGRRRVFKHSVRR